MRIGITLTLLLDLMLRLGDLEAHYTDTGVLPLEALFRYGWNQSYVSFYTITSSLPILAGLFFINIICVMCLLVGYRTRLFSVVCWIFLLSLQNRNPIILQAGDDLLRMILFWSIFLPWGYFYSVDSLLTSATYHKPTQYKSLAGFAYILQVFSVYFFTALLKSSPEWTSEFTALYYAFSLDQILLPIGQMIYPYETLLKILTAVTYYLEWLFPFVLFLPFYNQFFRTLFFLVFTGFHLGIFLTMSVGLFPLISFMAMFGLLPFAVMQRLHDVLKVIRSNVKDFFKRILSLFREKAVAFDYHGPALPKEGLFRKVIVGFFMIYVLLWNFHTTGKLQGFDEAYQIVGNFFKVSQFWGMFAPSVFKDDGWLVLHGKTQKEEDIDLNNAGSLLSFEKPRYVAGTYKNDRWRKYTENIIFVSNSHYRLYYCHYMMKQWNKEMPESESIRQLDVYYMKEISLPDYQQPVATKELLCYCAIE